MEEGLDAFVVVDGLPIVNEGNKGKLIKFLLKKLNSVGHTTEDAIYMPLNDEKKSEGYVTLFCALLWGEIDADFFFSSLSAPQICFR